MLPESADVRSKAHEQWMRHALRAAGDARSRNEVPIGACIVIGGEMVMASGNRTRTDCDPTAHAEIIALRAAAKKIGNYRLPEAIVYSTIEPCAMCAGALIQARIRLLVYGARDERAGAIHTHFQICSSDRLNHRVEVIEGVLELECRQLMQKFFKAKR
ncbi:MAG: tRNA adenosine(34) deaminase TadA [Pyrinomonadaceae bacterium]